ILEGYEKGEIDLEKINVLDAIHFINVAWNIDVKNAMDVEQILNYPSEKESLMESLTDEEIIQGVMDVPTDDE
ncbi:hypothetical protein Gohar_009445, partial [Gossypium harknessii]|nr:hypothetical protein [Gossypium harknessii]